jgi:hypothetical protein
MKNLTKLTEKQEIEICELYKNGSPIRPLSFEYHISVPRLKTILKKHSYKLRQKGKLLEHRYNKNLINKVIELYHSGQGMASISKNLNIPYNQVRMFLIKTNIQIRNENDNIYSGRTQQNRVAEIDSLSPQILEDYLNNLTWDEITKKYRISDTTLQKLLKVSKIKLRPRGFYSKKNITQKQKKEIVDIYVSGIPMYKIGPKFNVSHNIILRILKENDITIRPVGFGNHKNCNTSWGISGYYKDCYFRSMNELSFIINYLETKNIKWSSGEKMDGIQYFDSVRRKIRNYYPDFITNKYIFENKPKELWGSQEVIDKTIAAKKFCEQKNLIYRIIDYPVKITPIINKFLNNEIIFSKNGLEKFTRTYKKLLIL